MGHRWNVLVLEDSQSGFIFLVGLFRSGVIEQKQVYVIRDPAVFRPCDLAAGIKVSVLLCNSQGKGQHSPLQQPGQGQRTPLQQPGQGQHSAQKQQGKGFTCQSSLVAP